MTVWHFPQTFKEVAEIVSQEKVRFHSGGTSISPQMVRNSEHVVDIQNLPLHQSVVKNGSIVLGAGLTFHDVVEYITAIDPAHLLVKALKYSSSTPLRNRITLGGSIASFPVWSDLMGPLIALDSEITILDEAETQIPLLEYVDNYKQFKNKLVTSVVIPDRNLKSFYHRETRVQFDYPAFTISILAEFAEGKYTWFRLVVIGSRNKYFLSTKLNYSIIGKSNDVSNYINSDELTELAFNKKELGSGAYIKHLAGVWINRGLDEISGVVK